MRFQRGRFLTVLALAFGFAAPAFAATSAPLDDVFLESDEAPVALDIQVRFEPTISPSESAPMIDLAAALAEAERAKRRIVGFRAVGLPRFRGVAFHFEGPWPEARVLCPGKADAALPPRESVVFLYPEKDASASGCSVAFDRAFLRAELIN